MKIPAKIADIINQIGVRNLSFSEKRKLLRWYQQLNRDEDLHLTEEEEEATEKKIFNDIQRSIERKSSAKNTGFCFWLKRLLFYFLIAQYLNNF